MDRATAKTRLTSMGAAASRPVLTDPELEGILDDHRQVDSQGRLITDAGYLGDVWDLNAMAAAAWRLKAAKVAGDFSFTADGASYNKGDVLKNCLEMEASYAAKVVGTSRVLPAGQVGWDTRDLIP